MNHDFIAWSNMSTMASQDIYGFYVRSTIPGYFQVTESAAATFDLPYVLPDDMLPTFRHPQIDASSHSRLISLLPSDGPGDSRCSKEPIQCTMEVHQLV